MNLICSVTQVKNLNLYKPKQFPPIKINVNNYSIPASKTLQFFSFKCLLVTRIE